MIASRGGFCKFHEIGEIKSIMKRNIMKHNDQSFNKCLINDFEWLSLPFSLIISNYDICFRHEALKTGKYMCEVLNRIKAVSTMSTS